MMLLIKYRDSRPSDFTEIGHNFTNFEKSHWMMLHNKYQARTINKNILFFMFSLYHFMFIVCGGSSSDHRKLNTKIF